jgi:putative tryptophan/tyrosine transport system substrate-binding protein
MKRRDFITLLGGATAWPLATRAQQPGLPVIGFLNGQSPDRWRPFVAAFHQGLGETGYIEGQNVAIEYRWAEGHSDRVPALAAELVRRQVNIITATGGVTTAAKEATPTVPIVVLTGGDPVRAGLVASLNRPGGNVTGVSLFAFSLGPKRLEILRELIPKARVIAVLANPGYSDPEAKFDLEATEAAARAVGQEIRILNATNEREIEPAFASLVQGRDDALLVMADPFFNSRREQLVALAARHVVPAIYEWREFAAAGGLMSYGASITDAYRQVGIYTGKILRGAKPAELPFIQAVRVELILNLKTAKTLGITFPITLLGRADEVIE